MDSKETHEEDKEFVSLEKRVTKLEEKFNIFNTNINMNMNMDIDMDMDRNSRT